VFALLDNVIAMSFNLLRMAKQAITIKGGNMPKTAAEQGRQVAITLLNQLAFSAKMYAGHKAALVEDLLDEPPKRKELKFQILKGEAAVRTVHGEELEAENHFIFCVIHREFVPRSGMDAEHASSFTLLVARQKRLLKFLNDPANSEFVEAFLNTPGISDLFRIDTASKDKKIKGTKYFYKLCYNNDSNMWLLCHACNILKSKQEFITWARNEKSLGEPFVEYISQFGKPQEGVLFNYLAKENPEEDVILNMDGQSVTVCADPGRGYGELIRDRYLGVFAEEFETHKEFYSRNYAEFKEELNIIRELVEDGWNEKAATNYARLRRKNNKMLLASAAYRKQEELHSNSSGGEAPEVLQEIINTVSRCSGAEIASMQHELKALHAHLLERFDNNKKVVKAIIERLNLTDANGSVLHAVRLKIKEIDLTPDQAVEFIQAEIFKTLLKNFREKMMRISSLRVSSAPLCSDSADTTMSEATGEASYAASLAKSDIKLGCPEARRQRGVVKVSSKRQRVSKRRNEKAEIDPSADISMVSAASCAGSRSYFSAS
jgi:hypothetical protein